jgi:uncharacterized protein YecE (DUF72 family)
MKSLLRIGSCSFTAPGWEKTFYPPRLPKREYLRWYASKFDTLEIDSTFYATPAPTVTRRWFNETPSGFTFALKAPRAITHDKLLVGCGDELEEFLRSIEPLGEKVGTILLQFAYERTDGITFEEFLRRLDEFSALLPSDLDFAIEIRNREWLRPQLFDLLDERDITLALIDHPYMPPPEDLSVHFAKRPAYIRLLGDRHEIESITKSFHEVVVDRDASILHWTRVCREIVKHGVPVSVYVNNHYAGYAPATINRFLQLWDGSQVDLAGEQRILPL